MTAPVISDGKNKCSFDDALQIVGYGKYSIALSITCCLLILMMYVDIFGFSVMMPAVACDMELTTAQQGLLSAVPLIGVMISSYAWGLCADTLGRRTTLMYAMPVGVVFNFAASLAPNYATLAVLKFLSGCFTSSANAAAFVLLGESVPSQYRSRSMFLMATTTMTTQAVICIFAIPIFKMTFYIDVSWLGFVYRPWRLLMQVLCIPGIIGCICVIFMYESPKFLHCKSKEEEAMNVLKVMYKYNNRGSEQTFPVNQVFLDDEMRADDNASFLRRMWNQTAPLFKPPLLANSVILYYLLLCSYMTSTGYTMWVPTMTNAYFTGNEVTGKTFCEVASTATSLNNSTITDCNNTIQPMAIYATLVYSVLPGFLTILLSFIVGPLGKKITTHLVYIVCLICGILLFFVKIPLLSIFLFFMFLYVSLVLGNVNTYLVELNPTHLRGMATCLSVVVARGFGFISVQLIAALLADYCTPMLSGYVLLVASGLGVSFFLPPDNKKQVPNISSEIHDITSTEHRTEAKDTRL